MSIAIERIETKKPIELVKEWLHPALIEEGVISMANFVEEGNVLDYEKTWSLSFRLEGELSLSNFTKTIMSRH